ncbi:hypothetical protein RJ640_002801 [Escallonia rubra]|uniref:Mono-/di-acylglycerol lipase N-terminal domain-containing protein n=1 Tax=Escallonia rubra TaxID=112253 RepID=A0AA88UHP8_9ASTE|nr:hypothetical protein RJ640_002801 [Escallonia rubra]
MLLLLRAFHTVGSDDSATWASATADEFAPVPRVYRLILAVYEEDLPHGGYRLNPDWVVKRITYEQTSGHALPYLIDVDHEYREIVLTIRGLNLVKESNYKLFLDNALGMKRTINRASSSNMLRAFEDLDWANSTKLTTDFSHPKIGLMNQYGTNYPWIRPVANDYEAGTSGIDTVHMESSSFMASGNFPLVDSSSVTLVIPEVVLSSLSSIFHVVVPSDSEDLKMEDL